MEDGRPARVVGQFYYTTCKMHKPRRARSITKALVSMVFLRGSSCPSWLTIWKLTHYGNTCFRGGREARFYNLYNWLEGCCGPCLGPAKVIEWQTKSYM